MKVCWKCGADVADHHRFCMSCGADQTRADANEDPMIGRVLIGKYRIDAAIGAGAMGTIFRAHQLALDKTIVIKVLHRHLMGDAELLQRFEREARAASRLNHPNCVQIIDFGSLPDGSLYIAMEFIDGMDLADLLADEFPLPHLRVVRITKQICIALDEAHANGVLHRDLKPENIMLEDRRNAPDHVKVVDFGIAKLDEPRANRQGGAFETRAGIVCGTPEYMSPEQARGDKLDPRSDLYALGVLLYHMVTDHLPFEGESAIETVTLHLHEEPVHPAKLRSDLPEAFGDLILTLLAKDREQRPPSAMDVHAELERIERELLLLETQNGGSSSGDKTVVDMRPISALIDLIDLQTPHAEVRLDGSRSAASTARPDSDTNLEIKGPTGAAVATDETDTVLETAAVSASQAPTYKGPSDPGLRELRPRSVPPSEKTTHKETPPDVALARSDITHQALTPTSSVSRPPPPPGAAGKGSGALLWIGLGLILAGATVTAIILAT